MSESHATKDGEFQPVGKAQAQSLPGYVVVIPHHFGLLSD